MWLTMQNLGIRLLVTIFGDYSINRKSIPQGKPHMPIQKAAQRIIDYCRIKKFSQIGNS
jgi:hypothetical protein